MSKYRIFAGLGGGFGGADEVAIEEHNTLEEAETSAYEQACDCYESHAGYHGLPSWEECREEAESDFGDIDESNESELDEITEEIYNEHRESWIEYWVKEYVEGDEDDD